MRVLLLGATGLLGVDLHAALTGGGHEVFTPSKSEVNLLDRQSLNHAVSTISPNIIIHSAGYTDVEGAEVHFREAFDVNCVGVNNLLKCLGNQKPILVYLSTDYVFNGRKSSKYTETDLADPINRYGWTKWISEEIIRGYYAKHYIIRTSWLFGSKGICFPSKVIEKLQKNEILRIVDDQFGSPTYTEDLSGALLQLPNIPYGTYHIANSESVSWYRFACLIAEKTGLPKENIIPIQTHEYKSLAQRPRYSVLDCTKWSKCSGEDLSGIEESLEDYISGLKLN